MTTWIIIGVLSAIVGAMFVGAMFLTESDEGEWQTEISLAEHHQRGTHRVQYPDGYVSQRFLRKTAEDYAKMFGGKVVEEDR